MTSVTRTIEPRSARCSDNGFTPRAGFEPFRAEDAEHSIPDRFRRKALQRGSATAVIDGDTVVSYRALLVRASAFAAGLSGRLRERPGPVLVHLPIGAPAIEALLGVLFSGRPYVFLCASATEGEVVGTVAAAAPAAVVVEGPAAPHGMGGPLRISFDELAGARNDVTSLGCCARPHELACLFSTSGSTGTPKLVGLSHRAVLFDTGRQINDLCLGPDDRFDLLFSPSFSASLAPIFSALLSGGELHLLDVRGRLAVLGHWLERSAITVSRMTVSTLRTLCETMGTSGARPRPRLLSVGGEPLLPHDVSRFNALFPPSCVLQNAMASTETRTYAQYFVPRATPVGGVVPIGWPVHGKEVSIIDDDGRPVAEGEPGEIVVRSRYLATGYVNDPALTARRFLPQQDGTVLFRTGDRGRIRDDGCLMFLGRADSLVKIRGYRVEPEAVEAIVAQHPCISHAAVIVEEPVVGEPGLVAYAVPHPGERITTAELREYLASRLPAYAVPSSLALLDSLPVTPNGKVDRRALTNHAGRAHSPEYPQPSAGDARLALIEIWRDVLRRDDIGPRDSFFDCGGDSLNALRLQLAIQERFGIDLPLDVLVRCPTVEQVTAWLDRGREPNGHRGMLTVLQPAGSGLPLFCVPGIGGEPRHFEALVGRLGAGRPVYGLRAARTAREPVVPKSIDTMASEYLAEIDAVVSPDWPVLLCGHSLGGLVVFEMARRLRAAGRRVGLLAIIDMPLSRGGRPPLPRHVFRMLANLPAWIVYDGLASGWRNLAIRSVGKAQVAWQRVRAALGGPPVDGLNVRAYFGIPDAPARFRAEVNARFDAMRTYEPQPYPGTITLFRARAQALGGRGDRHLGWAGLAAGVEVLDVPGHHDSCVSEPHVRHLADLLNARMNAVEVP